MSREDPSPPATSLLDAGFLRRLERLSLDLVRGSPGLTRGEQLARARGLGTLFREHRPYVSGDDIRTLDWNAYLRTGDLVVKDLEAERSPRLTIVLDASASMAMDAGLRLRCAQRMAAAIGYVALVQHAEVDLLVHPSEVPPDRFVGQSSLRRFLSRLDGIVAGGAASFGEAASRLGRVSGPRGTVVLLSDFLSTEDVGALLRRFSERKGSPFVLHCGSRRDREVPDTGILELEDVETGRTRRVRIDRALAEAYRAAVRAHGESVRKASSRLGVPYHRVLAEAPFEECWSVLAGRNGLFR